MIVKTFVINRTLAGCTLQTAIDRMLPYIPERYVRDAFKHRDVKMAGVRSSQDDETFTGAEIKIHLPDECKTFVPSILYEDENLLIVDKPTGISCEADAKGGLIVSDWLCDTLPDHFAVPPVPCHRLDNTTDGILLLAKNEHALAAMEQAFFDRDIHKRYHCLVKGTPTPPEATLDAYLRKDAALAKVTVFKRPTQGALPIRTGYHVLEAGEVTRLEVTLYTGRTHQIRAHLAHIGHPLLGDDKYGDRTFNREHRARRLMLTASSLNFSIKGEYAYLNDIHVSLPPKF